MQASVVSVASAAGHSSRAGRSTRPRAMWRPATVDDGNRRIPSPPRARRRGADRRIGRRAPRRTRRARRTSRDAFRPSRHRLPAAHSRQQPGPRSRRESRRVTIAPTVGSMTRAVRHRTPRPGCAGGPPHEARDALRVDLVRRSARVERREPRIGRRPRPDDERRRDELDEHQHPERVPRDGPDAAEPADERHRGREDGRDRRGSGRSTRPWLTLDLRCRRRRGRRAACGSARSRPRRSCWPRTSACTSGLAVPSQTRSASADRLDPSSASRVTTARKMMRRIAAVGGDVALLAQAREQREHGVVGEAAALLAERGGDVAHRRRPGGPQHFQDFQLGVTHRRPARPSRLPPTACR